MDDAISAGTGYSAAETRVGAPARVASPPYQAYRILHLAFVAAPAIAGADKFFQLLTHWDQYLAPAIERLLPFSGHTFLQITGAVELAAACIVAVKPRIGAYVVAAWLCGIIVDLLLAGGFYDIALRDFGLALGALALGRLSATYDRATDTKSRPLARSSS